MTAGGPPGDPERRHPVLRAALPMAFASAWGVLGWAVVWVLPAAEAQFLRGRAPAWVMWVDLGVGVVACAALWWRRRHGVVVAFATSALAVVFGSVSGAAAVAFVSVVANRRLVWLAPLLGLNVVTGAVVLAMSLPQDGGVFAVVLIAFSIVAGQAALIGLGLWLRARRQLVASLRERAERAEAEREQALAGARLEERTRIAREMHDMLAHRISLVSMHAGALEYRDDASVEDSRAAAGVIRQHATLALQDLREVIGVLRDTAAVPDVDGGRPPRPQPTLADLAGLVEEGRRAGADVRLHTDVAQELSATAGRTAYRIVQEGLTNARKHGGPGPVDVTVAARRGEEILVAVTSPLRDSREEALRPVPGSGSGLIGLAERVRLAGGRLEHGVVGASFRLRAWLPWEEASG